MKPKAIKSDWYIQLAKGSGDAEKIQPSKGRAAPPAESQTVPPFCGKSRKLLTKVEACAELECSLTHLHNQLRARMIFAESRGRLVYIPIEECQNYRERERLRCLERYA
jgi:hypothetical protein